MYESDVEGNEKRKTKEAGGLLLKFVSPGISGVPDGLKLLPIQNKRHIDIIKKYVTFIEFKKPDKKPSTRQKRVMNGLNEMGYETIVIDRKN